MTKKIFLRLALLSIFVVSQGCTLGHQQFYSQVAPAKYPETANVSIFKYENLDLKEVYETFFSEYLIVGKSSFNGPYEDPESSEEFAKSIGADVFLTSVAFAETRTASMPLTTPSSSTTNFSGYSGRSSFSGTATTYGTQTTYVPITVNRYNQRGYFLRNMTEKKPLWERKRSEFLPEGESEFDGLWTNEKYEVSIFKSKGQIVGFISKCVQEAPVWKQDDIKLSFDPKNSFGVYFMGDKTPRPAEFKVNKFGHLEVALFGSSESFSFAKAPK